MEDNTGSEIVGELEDTKSTHTNNLKSQGHRKFYKIPSTTNTTESNQTSHQNNRNWRTNGNLQRNDNGVDGRKLFQMVENNLIGKDTVFKGPFGSRKCIYLDQTATGQPLMCIENYIRDHVMPYYANTHTTSTITSCQTTMYRDEARDIIRNSVGASEHDVVIFCGFGSTGPIHKLVQALAFNQTKKPIVFMGPYEHHSNIVPWRDADCSIVNIPETSEGVINIEYLEEQLKIHSKVKNRLMIGSFSAASNITGIMSDDVALTILMHRYNGLCFWDYSTAGPHVQIVMNPPESELAKKDAIFFSGHKFFGGPQTPGVLIAKDSLFKFSKTPNGGGGGSVFFVTNDSHRYLKNTENREEGGTPAIIESIRLGLVFNLKETIGSSNIVFREGFLTRKVLEAWKNIKEIKILGLNNLPRLPIISFLIEHIETGYYLHHNFVVTLLNDLFGIQSRGGCMCSGPYTNSLLNISDKLSKEYENILLEDSRLDRKHLRRKTEGCSTEIFRPGFTRISFPFHCSQAQFEFIIDAVQLISQEGWKLLPLYKFDPETGEFIHHADKKLLHHRKWLSSAIFDSSGIYNSNLKSNCKNENEINKVPDYNECIDQAKNLFNNAHNLLKRKNLPDQAKLFESEIAHLRWFLLPSEALTLLNNNTKDVKRIIKSPRPYKVRVYNDASVKFSQNSVPSQLCDSIWHKNLEFIDDFHRLNIVNKNMESKIVFEKNQEKNALNITAAKSQLLDETITSDENQSNIPISENESRFKDQLLTQVPFLNENQQTIKNVTRNDQICGENFAEILTIPQNNPEKVNQVEVEKSVIEPDATVMILNVPKFSLSTETGTSSTPITTIINIDGNSTSTSSNQNTSIDENPIKYQSLSLDIQSPHSISSENLHQTNIRMLSPDSVFSSLEQEQLEIAMQRKTNEIANEIKLEIRDVISQVEQSMSPKSIRERASSFNMMVKSPTFNQIKARKRSLSGCQLNISSVGESCDSSISNCCSNEKNEPNSMKSKNSTSTLSNNQEIKAKWHCPSKNIFKPTLKAIREYSMIKDGDRLLVCLSGGKDSLSLLHVMKQLQYVLVKENIRFELGAVTVDPGSTSYNPRPLIPYLKSLGVPYFYEEQDIMPMAIEKGPEDVSSICSYCSRMKRGRIYACARRNGYNVLAFGQHLDDISESFFMSVLHNGLLRTMKASYIVKEEDLRVIRPLINVREIALREFAETKGLPVIPENCPGCFDAPTERQRIKMLLAQQEVLFPRIFSHLRSALEPLLSINKTGNENKKKMCEAFTAQNQNNWSDED